MRGMVDFEENISIRQAYLYQTQPPPKRNLRTSSEPKKACYTDKKNIVHKIEDIVRIKIPNALI